MKFTIGSDPEVALSSKSTGRVRSALDFFREQNGYDDDHPDCSDCSEARIYCDWCGCDEDECECEEDRREIVTGTCDEYDYDHRCPNSTSNPYHAPFGCDGAADTAEFRPEPATDPEEAANNCINLVRNGIYQLEDADLDAWAGGYAKGQSLGGHVHFGVPYDETIRNALDAFIGAPLHQVCPAGETRNRGGYANFGAIETKNYGFEYRTPPSWLTAPWMVRAVYHISWHVMRQFLEGTLPPSFRIDRSMLFPREGLRDAAQFDAIKEAWKPAFKSCHGPVSNLWGLLGGKDFWQSHEPINKQWLGERGTTHTEDKPSLHSRENKSLVLLPSRDDCVADVLNRVRITDRVRGEVGGITIYVYGVRSNRGDEVWVSRSLQLRTNSMKYLRENHGLGIRRGRHGEATSHKYSIGLPYSLRRNDDRASYALENLLGMIRPRRKKRRKK